MKYKDHSITPQFDYFLVWPDFDCYQIPFRSVEAAQAAIDNGPDFLLEQSHIHLGAEGVCACDCTVVHKKKGTLG